MVHLYCAYLISSAHPLSTSLHAVPHLLGLLQGMLQGPHGGGYMICMGGGYMPHLLGLLQAELQGPHLLLQPSPRPRGRVRVWVRATVRTIFERRSGDRTRVDGVCDFEKVPPDQLCPSARARVRVRARGPRGVGQGSCHIMPYHSTCGISSLPAACLTGGPHSTPVPLQPVSRVADDNGYVPCDPTLSPGGALKGAWRT